MKLAVETPRTQSRKRRKIVTSHVYPPIPVRTMDWCAHDDNYEPGCPIGWGATEAEAIADYHSELADLAEEAS